MNQTFAPTQFGRYLLTERIAVGGMAEIFTAKMFGAMGFEKQLVIKRILPRFAVDADFLRMFITEAKLVCHFEHPNIVQVHDLGEIDGQYYIAMEYVNGLDARRLWRTLAKRRQRLPGPLALYIVGEFLKGLDYAHRAVGADGELLGVVHRDVSLSNVLISYRGDVKIGDFGIALVQQESQTQTGVLKGKFGYMSPEQVAGMAVDHRSDIFAAGVVLAELLLGRRLFLGHSDFETLDKVLNVRLDVLREHEKVLPPEVAAIIYRALARNPDDRFPTARDFQDALDEYLYERRERINNETLASFIAEYVSPFLEEETSAEGSAQAEFISRSSKESSTGKAARRKLLEKKAGEISSEEDLAASAAAESVAAESAAVESATAESAAAAEGKHVFVSFEAAEEDIPIELSEESGLEAEQEIIAGEEIIVEPSEEAAPLELAQEEGGFPEEKTAARKVPAETKSEKSPEQPRKQGPSSEIAPIEIEPEKAAEPAPMAPIPSVSHVFEKKKADAPQVAYAGRGDITLDNLFEDDLVHHEPGESVGSTGLVNAQLTTAALQTETEKSDFHGELTERTMAKIIFRFAMAQQSGLLVITGPESVGRQADYLAWLRQLQSKIGAQTSEASTAKRTCEIHLQQGQPHLVSADRSEEALVAFLLRIAVLKPEQVKEALEKNSQRRPIAALLAQGTISPLRVSRYVTSFVIENVLDTFSWTDGEFAFYGNRAEPAESFPTGMDCLALIHKGVQSLDSEYLEAYFKQLQEYRLSANESSFVGLDAFQPDEELGIIYNYLASPKTIDEIVTACKRQKLDEDLMQRLYLLLECELVGVC